MGYSPYGTEIAGEGFAQDSTLRYRYASKERQDTRQVLPEISGVAAYRSTIPGIINFGARMYDPLTGSWLSPDPLAHKYTSWSPYAYCAGNPVNFVDPDGRLVGTLFDAASVTLGVKNFIDNVRAGNTRAAIGDGVGVVIDVVAAALPVIPGGVGFVRTGTKTAKFISSNIDVVKLNSELSSFEKAGEFGVDSYYKLRQKVLEIYGKNSGLEVHHLIEQRFASKLGIKEADIPSIVLTKDEHRKFTNAWRNEIRYNSSNREPQTHNAELEQILNAARNVYKDYPEILNVIEEMMK